ncbi:DegQ family serine endoprotease [Noviherbaspirillum aerium]|uniref:DegQ family serine endoprotease n=1 Tax=Noviherbaspirillum aerium TaxID=2588497 RepID=UPI00124E1D98|nr:DegQ family serine endoprotease [Noviherbaspirillum aerium]
MIRKTVERGIVAASLVAAGATGFAYFDKSGWGRVDAAALPNAAAQGASQGASQAVVTSVPGVATATDFSGIVQTYGPAVVNISVIGKAQQTPAANGQMQIDPRDPFSGMLPFFGQRAPRETPMVRGQGSGFIVSPDGLILTNAHVVDGASEVTVKLADRREYKAKVLGSDKQTDVAVIRIEAKNLPVVRLGDPAGAKVGEPVLAIGAPFGLENTATAGIISAKSRALPEDTYVPFIQTDVAVNPGNSGGPLFNLKGEVIGINSQIYSRTGGYQGLSFAIPIDVATRVQEQLVKHGKVTRGRLGVSIQEVNQALADSFGLQKLQGALVSAVEKGSAAERAGLEAGDVIVRFNDRDITQSADLPALVAATAPGTAVKLEVIRKGAPKVLTATISELKDAALAQREPSEQEQGRLGLAVRPLEKQEQREAGVAGGLLVEDVTGPAARSGIQPGDIVLSINGTPVTSAEQLRALASKAGRNVALLVQRDEAKIFVPLQLG